MNIRRPPEGHILRADGTLLIEHLLIAHTLKTRMLGLLPYRSLPPDTAMWFPRCRAIHTFFMRFSIDVLFLSDDFRVVEQHHRVKTGTLVYCADRNGRHTVELSTGRLAKMNLQPHEQLQISSPS